MKPCVFESSVVLEARIETVYRFHENPNNLLSISPSWLDARIENASSTARAGEEFLLRVGLRGLPLKVRWRGYWQEVRCPELLVDGAKESPFQFWEHQHRFEAIGPDRTRMTDHVMYRFPGGWLGKIFGETFGRLQFYIMFADRGRRTRRWMREHGSEPGPATSAL